MMSKAQCVFLEICTPSLFSPTPLRGGNFKSKQAQNLWHHKYLDPCTWMPPGKIQVDLVCRLNRCVTLWQYLKGASTSYYCLRLVQRLRAPTLISQPIRLIYKYAFSHKSWCHPESLGLIGQAPWEEFAQSRAQIDTPWNSKPKARSLRSLASWA